MAEAGTITETESAVALNTGRFDQRQTDYQIYGSASGCGALRVTQIEPANLELARAGARFAIGQSGAITGTTSTTSMPTTAAHWTFWNASTTKSLVFEALGAYIVNGVGVPGATVVCAHFILPASNTSASGITVANLSNGTEGSVAVINATVTIVSPAAPAWSVIARDDSPNTGTFRTMAVNDRLAGSIIVPPRRGLGLCVINAIAAAFGPMAQWSEVALDLE